MVLGGIICALPPIVLANIYGNKEITGSITNFLWVIPLIEIVGLLTFVTGLRRSFSQSTSNAITEKLRLDKPVSELLVGGQMKWTDGPGFSSIFWSALALWSFYFAAKIWNEPEHLSPTPYTAIIFITVFLVAWILWKIFSPRTPLYAILLGVSYKPQDEREAMIFTKAGLNSMCASVIILFLLFGVFLYAPRPNQSALFQLFYGIFALQRAIFQFIAWRMGLGRK